jgi:outer membrane murein-binding lipoprotein Lpp
MSSPSVVTKDTLIPITLVIVVLSAAFSYGIMYQKVENVGGEVKELKVSVNDKIDKLDNKVDQLSENVMKLIGLRTISYGK